MKVLRSIGFGIVIVAASLHSRAEQGPATPAKLARAGAPARGGETNASLNSIVRPDLFGTIQGNALDSTNGQLANATVRLRDARFGRILGSQLTDESGLFTFRGIDPGSYIVEMMGNDDTILAASQVLNINAGDAASAIVKLPFRLPPFAHVIGTVAPNTASSIVAQAAATGLLAVTPIGEPTCSQ